MCLDVELSEKIKKPLKVYKSLCITEDGLKSPCQNKYYNIGTKYTESIRDIYDNANVWLYLDNNMRLVVKNGIHSWASLRTAVKFFQDQLIIFDAEIPKGSLVIRGNNDDIVSSEIIINPYFYKPIKFLGHIYYKKIKYSEEQLKPFNY